MVNWPVFTDIGKWCCADRTENYASQFLTEVARKPYLPKIPIFLSR